MAAPAGEFKCSKCDRSFSMAAHLARHMSTIHASPKARAAKKAKAAREARAAKRRGGAKVRAKVGAKRRKGAVRRARMGRPSGAVARLGLRRMTLDQLAEVIEAARGEANSRITQFRRTFT